MRRVPVLALQLVGGVLRGSEGPGRACPTRVSLRPWPLHRTPEGLSAEMPLAASGHLCPWEGWTVLIKRYK